MLIALSFFCLFTILNNGRHFPSKVNFNQTQHMQKAIYLQISQFFALIHYLALIPLWKRREEEDNLK